MTGIDASRTHLFCGPDSWLWVTGYNDAGLNEAKWVILMWVCTVVVSVINHSVALEPRTLPPPPRHATGWNWLGMGGWGEQAVYSRVLYQNVDRCLLRVHMDIICGLFFQNTYQPLQSQSEHSIGIRNWISDLQIQVHN